MMQNWRSRLLCWMSCALVCSLASCNGCNSGGEGGGDSTGGGVKDSGTNDSGATDGGATDSSADDSSANDRGANDGSGDSSPLCGNRDLDPGETCDPQNTCPTTCDDGNDCTADRLTGSAATCDVVCVNQAIENCEEVFGAEPNPTGNPIGGGPGYDRILCQTASSGDFNVSTREELLDALTHAVLDDVICIAGDAVIDMTHTSSATIPAGVTLASNRGLAGSLGATLKRTENEDGGWEEPMFIAGGDNVRVTGLQLEGEMFIQDWGNDDVYSGSINERYYLVGVFAIGRSGFEVDNNEMRGWAWSCISLRECSNAHVHHNYIHHNQARGEGYGTNLYGGSALIEGNLYDYNRHAITGAGLTGEKYEARYNIVLGNGDAIGGHHFDVHQNEDGLAFAGDWFLIHHNTFRAGIGENGMILASVGIRHRPDTGCFIDHNLFEVVSTETEDGKPIWQLNSNENLFATDNKWMGVLYLANDGIVWFR